MALELDKFLLAFITFSVFIVAGVFIVGNVNNNYGDNLNTSDFSGTYNVIDDMYNLSQDMKQQTIDADINEVESWESMTKGSYSAVRLVKNTFKLIGQILEDIASTLGVPAFFIKFAIAALTISIIFAVIFLFLRYK